MFIDRIIRKMRESIFNVIESKIGRGKSDVTLFVEPDGLRVPVRDQHPLSDIEFFVSY
jgi:hypothetical protein